MCIKASDTGIINIYHYNSASIYGPETGIIKCDMNT